MTERWKKRLGDLDKASPGDDVYERAKGGPQLPEEAIERPSTSSRVVTGVAAFLIFALAISVFAIPALRLREGAGGQPLAGVQPLWPWQTLDEVEAFVDAPSPIGFIGSGAFFDPSETAWAFGHEVLGWDELQVTDLTGTSGSDSFCGVGTPVDAPSAPTGLINDIGCQDPGGVIPYFGDYPPNVSASSGPPDGYACIDYCGGPTTAPTAPGSSSPSSPYRVFELAQATPPCSRNELCAPQQGVLVTVYQPLSRGDGEVWAVLDAASRSIDLSVGVGSVIRDGSSVSVAIQLQDAGPPSLGLVMGAGDCLISLEANAASSTIQQPNGVVAAGMRLDVDLPARPAECSSTEPGYVFVALNGMGTTGASLDPIHERPRYGLIGLAAVPVIVEWTTSGTTSPPQTGETPPPPPPVTSPAPVEWTTYTDPLGWTIDVPESWTVEPLDEFDGGRAQVGARFFTGSLNVGGGPLPGEVLVTISHFEGGPLDVPGDDSLYNLSFDALEPNERGRQLTFRGDGLPFTLDVRGGTGGTSELSPAQGAIVRGMIESIRFEHWARGEQRNGWVSVGDIGQVQPPPGVLVHEGETYLVWWPGEAYFTLLGPVPTCAEAAAESVEGEILVLSCAGMPTVRYDFQGSPLEGNPDGFRDPLGQHPAIISWDYHVLIAATA